MDGKAELIADALAIVGTSAPDTIDVFAQRALRRVVNNPIEYRARRSSDEMVAAVRARRERIRSLLQGDTAERPGRSHTPSRKKIARHHGLPEDACWRCGSPDFIERAHIVDRSHDGLDQVQNLALLCAVCHWFMPAISPQNWLEGMRYVGLSQ